jgi:small subunit ribosomal protein S9
MAEKKIVKKEKDMPMPADREKKVVKDKYFSGIGRRKAAIARVRLFEVSQKKPANDLIMVNERTLKQFMDLSEMQEIAEAPLKATDSADKFSVTIKVRGGGIRGQAEAIRLGIARALVKFNEDFRKNLRDLGYLTRDARVVERKKAGLKKARRAPQWQKR